MICLLNVIKNIRMMENIEELELAEGGVVLHAAALCWLTRKVTLGR